MDSSVIGEKEVEQFMQETGFDKFHEIQHGLREINGGRLLVAEERQAITSSIAKMISMNASIVRENELLARSTAMSHASYETLLFTAYSKDYSIGYLCEHVNRMYANRHGFQFRSFVAPYKDMIDELKPRTHCTWYKILMLRRLLEEMLATQNSHNILYIMWIDADAVVIDHSISLKDIIARAHHRDLIIAEDMNPGCLVNAGVLLIRVSEWSRMLWQKVWECNNYDTVTFYEQSALIRTLKGIREGLNHIIPFHSYLPNGPSGDKLFAHVCVLPHLDFNSNRGWKKHRSCVGDLSDLSMRKKTLKQAYNDLLQQNLDASVLADDRNNFMNSKSAGDVSDILIRQLESVTMTPIVGIKTCEKKCDDVIAESTNSDKMVKGDREEIHVDVDHSVNYSEAVQAKFIFHPAGLPDKLQAIKGMLQRHKISIPEHLQGINGFSLFRGKLGSVPHSVIKFS